jgi:5'-deoxynucleotidase YfbR-like HD superfamily hydrolase
MISLFDIAHGLANNCRFNGQTVEYYSVAEHSVYAAKLAISLALSQEIVSKVLLHDAAEAYLGDVVTPIKNTMPKYKIFEQNLMAAIYYRFGLVAAKGDSKIIKRFDEEMLACEQNLVINQKITLPYRSTRRAPYTRLSMWQPLDARREFLTLAQGNICCLK